jgi:hypothetical protein
MQTEKVKKLEELVKNMIEAPSITNSAESLENRSAERKISPVLRNLAGGNPLQAETQTFKPSHYEDLETSRP